MTSQRLVWLESYHGDTHCATAWDPRIRGLRSELTASSSVAATSHGQQFSGGSFPRAGWRLGV